MKRIKLIKNNFNVSHKILRLSWNKRRRICMLSKEFKTKEEVLKLKFKTRCNHNPSDGKHREYLIQTLLEFIPDKFSVCNGFVFDSHNNMSKEIDLIIYDSLYVPKFFRSVYSLIPIESIVAIIQVKTTLTKSEFRKAIDNVNSIDCLIPEKGGTILTVDRGPVHEKRILAPLKVVVAGKSKTRIDHTPNFSDIDIIYTLEDGDKDELKIKTIDSSKLVSNELSYLDLMNNRKAITNYTTYKTDKMKKFAFTLLQLLIGINNTLIINYKKYDGDEI